MKKYIGLKLEVSTARKLIKQIEIAEGEGFHYDDTNKLKEMLEKWTK